MVIYYRISDAGYSKVKPNYITNENCLRNFCNVFSIYTGSIKIIADNCSQDTLTMIKKYINPVNIEEVSVGHGAGTFNLALDIALKNPEEEVVYFVESDYIHKQGAAGVLLEGFELGTDFLTLYDHPDKYFDGPNPYVSQGGEDTKVFLSRSCHWKFTNSTTMTFAGRVSALKKYESIFRQYTSTHHPHDFEMWIALRNQNASLISPMPGYSTHGETAWLAPLNNWESYVNSNT